MKHKNKFRILRKNRGFAILFALGILTVVLVVVMLFASKAKVSSTISAIHLENQSARTLAKSLVPRIMLTLNMSPSVQDQVLYSSIYDHQNNDLNKDYIDEICKKGAFMASRLAQRTLEKTYKKVGLVLPKAD